MAAAARPRRRARACRRRPRAPRSRRASSPSASRRASRRCSTALVPECGADRRRRRALHGRGVGGTARPHRRRRPRAALAARRRPPRATTTDSPRPRASRPLTLPLAPLEPAAALLLVVQLTEDAPLPAHVAAAIAQRSDGSPLFVTEMVRAMRAGADHDTLPESVEALMALQIDELASADRGVLRQASVIGVALHARRPDGRPGARRGRRATAILERLDGFLVADDDGGPRLPPRAAARRRLPRAVVPAPARRCTAASASRSSSRAGTDVADVAADLTHHFFEAGLWEKSLRYGLIAGSAARAVYANVDAAAVLDRAVAAGTSWRGARPEAVMLAAEALGDVRLSLGEFDRARAAFAIARAPRARRRRRARPAAAQGGRRRLPARRVRGRAAHPARPRSRCSRARAACPRRRSAPASRRWLGIITLWRGRPRESVDMADSVRSPMPSRSTPRRRSRTRSPASTWPTTRSATRGARPTARGRSSSTGSSAISSARAACSTTSARSPTSRAAGTRRSTSTARRSRPGIRRATRAASRWRASTSARSSRPRAGSTRPSRCCARPSGPAARPAALTDIAESLMETALLEARRGNLERALAQLEEARAPAREDRQPVGDAADRRAHRGGARARRRVRSRRGARGAHARARGRATRASALVLPVLNRVLGQAHLVAGRLDAAREALELAIAEANRVEHRYEEALALAALNRLGDAPSEAAARRDSALRAARDRRPAGRLGQPTRRLDRGLPRRHRVRRRLSRPRSSGRSRPCRRSSDRRVRRRTARGT